MESLQGLKTRLRAVKNVGTITKAMEVVSATKMRKSQEVALRTRPYAIEALDMLRKVARHVAIQTIFTTPREIKKTLLVVMASDRGLTGAFNTQVIRKMEQFFAGAQEPVAILAVGKKIERYATTRNLELIGAFSGFGDFIAYEEVGSLADVILRGFEGGQWDRVVTISTHFRTTLKQEVLVREILPTNSQNIEETIKELVPERGRYADFGGIHVAAPDKDVDYILEPSAEAIVQELMPYLVRMQVYHLVLEANASEHSARRVAMKTASDNAKDLSGKLTLSYNKVRQAAITKEIIEITGTQNALEAV